MEIKSILVPIRGDGRGELVLDYARLIASRSGAHIQAVHAQARPEDYLPFGTLISGKMRETILQSAITTAKDEEDHYRVLFTDYCTRNKLTILDKPPSPGNRMTASWREETGKQAAVIARRGRLTDLIVVPKPENESRLGANTLESALMETGKLVLMAPPAPATQISDHIAVAWSGSAEAARAVALAMPLLCTAKKVTLLTAETGEPQALGADDLVDHLRWHNIEPDVQGFNTSNHDVGGPLLARCQEIGADCLLMGAFGHNRNRELILGGVTQYVIENTELPILFAH